LKTKALPHIAIVVNSIEPGSGVSNVAVAQAKALSQYFSISLLCAKGTLNYPNIKVFRVTEPKLLWLRRFGHVVREFILCRRFSKKLKAIHESNPLNFVLFHSHTSAAMSGLNKTLSTALVVHGDIFTRPKGSYDKLLTWFYKYNSKRAYRTIKLVIALSPVMKKKAISYGISSERVVVIPNGIDVNAISAKLVGKREREGIDLLFVGRLAPEKAPLVLLEALTLLDSPLVRLYMAGSGPQESMIRDFILDNGLNDQVKLLGHLQRSEIEKLYLTCDLLCVPSINDPLPTVVLEAMSIGLPVVASGIDGIPFMIDDSVNGLLVSPNKPKELSEAINRLAGSATFRKELAKAAQKKIIDRFSLDAVTKQLVDKIFEAIRDTNKFVQ